MLMFVLLLGIFTEKSFIKNANLKWQISCNVFLKLHLGENAALTMQNYSS